MQRTNPLKLQVDDRIELKQVESSDSKDIFRTIDSQREYLGKWLPFVEQTRQLADTENFVDSVMNAPEGRFEYVFVIKTGAQFVVLIGFKDTDKQNRKTEIGYCHEIGRGSLQICLRKDEHQQGSNKMCHRECLQRKHS